MAGRTVGKPKDYQRSSDKLRTVKSPIGKTTVTKRQVRAAIARLNIKQTNPRITNNDSVHTLRSSIHLHDRSVLLCSHKIG